uniref:Transmembrane protein n=1 Tax=Lotharella globosa TaxID=91324 RepID=A0A7S4DXC0_9EUKA
MAQRMAAMRRAAGLRNVPLRTIWLEAKSQRLVRFLSTSAPKKKFKLPMSLMGLWWFGIWGVPVLGIVGYAGWGSRFTKKDTRYKSEEDQNAPVPDERMEPTPSREKVGLMKNENEDLDLAEEPWKQVGTTKSRYREMQRKNDVNIAKIHAIIKRNKEKGPSAWND